MKEVWVLTERTDFNRGGEWDYENYRSGSRVFSSFEAARKAMRKRIVELAHEEGSMFHDGSIGIASDAGDEDDYYAKGEQDLQEMLDGIANDENYTLSTDRGRELLEKYKISSLDVDFDDPDKPEYTAEQVVKFMEEKLELRLSEYDGKEVEDFLSKFSGGHNKCWSNMMYGFGLMDSPNAPEPELLCHACSDGSINGFNPYVYINCFEMNCPDKKYSFHIDDFHCPDIFGVGEPLFISHMYLDLEKVAVEE